jgi:Fe2+ or Zn2+ uptake regulation protein
LINFSTSLDPYPLAMRLLKILAISKQGVSSGEIQRRLCDQSKTSIRRNLKLLADLELVEQHDYFSQGFKYKVADFGLEYLSNKSTKTEAQK